MKKLLVFFVILLTTTGVWALDGGTSDPKTSADGKYHTLVQVMECPRDTQSYGNYRDYGYWKGGAWCGQQGKAGYWVWVAPKWYVWAAKSSSSSSNDTPPRASVNGKYSNLIQKLKCVRDRRSYGDYRDYGYWGGGPWCGRQGKAGYWVWVAPYWYVWGAKN
jgi:hypothetical protein